MPPSTPLETFRHAAIPQTEFWSENPHRHSDIERFFTKEASSAAHIYGQNLVAQEGETSIGPQWSESLATDLKPAFDMAITEGMNRLVWHEFTSSPNPTALPGQEYFAGTHLNPKITWWNQAPAFFNYLNRLQFLMQQGSPVSDILYLYGDSVPNFVRLKSEDPAHALPGYDYDVTNEDALLHTIRNDHGQLTGPSGITWRALALPATRRLSLPVLTLVEAYVRQGGTVIGAPPDSPSGQPTPADLATFHTLAARLWESCKRAPHHPYAKGHVFCTPGAHAALQALHIPQDVTASNLGAASASPLDYIHRGSPQGDLYFLRNGSSQAVSEKVSFRVRGKDAELWDAVAGTMTPIATESHGDQRIVPFTLPPYGSAVILFINEASTPAKKSAAAENPGEQKTEPLQLSEPWSLSFEPNRGALTQPVSVPELKSWTESSDPGVRFFSGSATYRAKVTAPSAPPGARILLHLTDVREIARVRIDGKEAGTVWAIPYALDVTALLHSGLNDIEIEVTNLWPNRIIGDLQPNAGAPYTQTNITKFTSASPLLPSGLIGPVVWWLR